MNLLEVILSRNKQKSCLGVGWSWHMIKNRVQPKMTNTGTIYDIKIDDKLEEIFVRMLGVGERSCCALNHSGTFCSNIK